MAVADGSHELCNGCISLFGNRTCRPSDYLAPRSRRMPLEACVRQYPKRMDVGRRADCAADELLRRGIADGSYADGMSVESPG